MKKFLKFTLIAFTATTLTNLAACSDDDKEPDDVKTIIVGFSDVSSDLFGGPTSYGANLYYGAEYQITKGYIAPLAFGKYAQFSINYAEQEWVEGKPWQYTYYNGGIALSSWHDMTGSTYENQLSVYNSSSPSGGNFAVAFGNSPATDPKTAKYADYSECAKVYITDANGYGISAEGQKYSVAGDDEEAWFKSVYINNTTYTFLTLKNGNTWGGKPIEDQKGWFKVQFIAFDDDDPDERPLGYVEAYLANFDPNLKIGYTGIVDEWMKVDLSSLPECGILVINFVGSDSDPVYGLNTPAYCALDKFEIKVED